MNTMPSTKYMTSVTYIELDETQLFHYDGEIEL